MIKNTHKAVTDYATAYKQANTVYKQAVAEIKANYKEGSPMFKSAMKTAKDILNTALIPMKDTYKGIVKKDLDDVRKAINQAVAVPPSAELLGILPMIREGKLNEAELQVFIDKYKGNYMNSKMLYDAMGKHFTTIEELTERIDRLEAGLNGYFDSFAGEEMDSISYGNALVLNGSIIDSVDSLTDEFVSAYAVQGFDNKE